jgi:hypothetical protein
MFHHNNAPGHASLLMRSYVAKHQTSVMPHPPYSPDLAPADFILFPKLTTTLKGRRFQTFVTLSPIRRTTSARAQFSGCSSTSNAHSETGQMEVCCQKLTLGVLSSRIAISTGWRAISKVRPFFEHALYVTRITVRNYPRFHVTTVGPGTCYPWIRGHTCIHEVEIKSCILTEYTFVYQSRHYTCKRTCKPRTKM